MTRLINKKLQMLLPEADLGSAGEIQINQLTMDSRVVKNGGLFIAIKGQKVDGREFIAKAVEQGAAAILVEADKKWQSIEWINQLPVIAVDNLPEKISLIASRFYNNPNQNLSLIAVTGTNGKTTCSLLAAQLLARVQQNLSGVIGTLGYGVLNNKNSSSITQQIQLLSSTGLTTPDAISLQSILCDMNESGVKSVAMEVSSHSLHQHRVAALQFHTAIFTNLTQDHLDYHGDMQTYGKVKAELLKFSGLQYAIINIDDEWASSLGGQASASVKVIRYSVQKNDADIYVRDIQLHAQGVNAELVTPWGNATIASPLMGLFNLSNLIAVIAAVCAQGFSLDTVVAQLPELVAAPGRMQSVVVDTQQDINVIVDYAHTPDALETTLKAIKQHNQQRIWTVFGCGGDRDKTKRPLMGRIAEMYSDYVLITNDNPRSEDPALIAADIIRGMKNPRACLTIADRAQAIDMAIQQAKSADLVLIAGKGHENYQIFAQQTLAFSDEQQVRLALQRRLVKQQANIMPIKGAQL
jgi:UDP-N-acetylmuramoyl-L-alanyl-D-glutamate--2,6-diaminopimelate ligase